MHAHDADAFVHQSLHEIQLFVDVVPVAAIAIHDDRRHAIERVRILGPVVGCHDGVDIWIGFHEALGEQHAARSVFVFAGAVARMAGDEEDFRLAVGGVGGRRAEYGGGKPNRSQQSESHDVSLALNV